MMTVDELRSILNNAPDEAEIIVDSEGKGGVCYAEVTKYGGKTVVLITGN